MSSTKKIRKLFFQHLSKDFEIPTVSIEKKIFREYGAMFVAQGDVEIPPRVIFRNEDEVIQFQSKLKNSSKKFGEIRIELQTAAMKSLKNAVKEAEKNSLTITPRGSDSARRSYAETVSLWKSRVNPGLEHWIKEKRLDEKNARKISNLSPVEQIPEIFKLERRGIFFSKDLSKTIMYSVAPPGTSQHLSMLALDINEHTEERVREIMANHGWFQTVISDLPHFTFLGIKEADCPLFGLKKVEHCGRFYWIPNI